MRLQLTGLALMSMLAGCQDRRQLTGPAVIESPAPSAAQNRVAYLSVSDSAPEVGSMIVVAGTVGVGDSLSMASFLVHLTYDESALSFVDAITLPDMMRVINPQAHRVTIAGASGSGTSDGRLFALRFRVQDPAGLASLRLEVAELNDREFTNRVPSLRTSSTLQLDRRLASGRVIRR